MAKPINVDDVKRLLDVMKEMQFSYRPIPLDMREMIVNALEGLLEERKTLESQVPCWIPVEERLPEDDEMYLVYTTEHTCAVYRYWGDGEWETEWSDDVRHNISHWMPLPEPPKEE